MFRVSECAITHTDSNSVIKINDDACMWKFYCGYATAIRLSRWSQLGQLSLLWGLNACVNCARFGNCESRVNVPKTINNRCFGIRWMTQWIMAWHFQILRVLEWNIHCFWKYWNNQHAWESFVKSYFKHAFLTFCMAEPFPQNVSLCPSILLNKTIKAGYKMHHKSPTKLGCAEAWVLLINSKLLEHSPGQQFSVFQVV